MYLLDTDVISALRRSERHPALAEWLRIHSTEDIYISVTSIGEMELRIRSERRRDAVYAEHLTRWLAVILERYSNYILPVDSAIARRWGELAAALGNMNRDLLIAATALERNLTVVTRNVSDFEPAGVQVVNPFEA